MFAAVNLFRNCGVFLVVVASNQFEFDFNMSYSEAFCAGKRMHGHISYFSFLFAATIAIHYVCFVTILGPHASEHIHI